jgi:hypothetical protein
MSIRRQAMAFVGTGLAALALAPPSFGETVFALAQPAAGGFVLEQFDSATPGTVSGPVAITGLQAGEGLVAIDFRPATGGLYALSNAGRLYALNTTTGVATQIGMGTVSLTGNFFGMDFNPVVDRIRVVSDADMNLRLNPNDGTLVGGVNDTALAYAMGDTNVGKNPNVVALGYSNNVAGAATTTLYAIDSLWDVLVTLGSPGGSPTSPNTGQLFTVGPLGSPVNLDITDAAGLDISPIGNAYAVLHTVVNPVGAFYTMNLGAGIATLVGAIAGQASVVDIAVRAGPSAVRMQSLSAVRTARGVSVRWRTGSSLGTLGFNVYRQQQGRRVRLNSRLIVAGSAVAGQRYSFLDRRPLRSARYWVQAVGSDGSRTWYGPVGANRTP